MPNSDGIVCTLPLQFCHASFILALGSLQDNLQIGVFLLQFLDLLQRRSLGQLSLQLDQLVLELSSLRR